MTSDTHFERRRKGAPLFYAGWAGFALFGVLVFADGHAELSYGVLHVLVAAAMCTWYAMTAGRAALVVGAVLGVLFALQMGFFLYSDLFTGDDPALKTMLEDAFGLVAAALIVSGSVLGLRSQSLSFAREAS